VPPIQITAGSFALNADIFKNHTIEFKKFLRDVPTYWWLFRT